MDVKYESAIKVVSSNVDSIYDKLSDFNNFGSVIPQDRVKNWSSTTDICRFTVDQIGEVGLRIVDREPNATVKYTADGETRFNFNIWVQMKEVGLYDSRIKVTMKADINPMVKMMFGSHLQKFVDVLADAIAMHQY